jgi:hypothetical protein
MAKAWRALRWCLALPVAAFAVLMLQYATFQLAGSVLWTSFGVQPWTTWTAKSVSALFMGIAFVAIATWVAPVRKRQAALIAFAVVAVWTLALVSGAFAGAHFSSWLVVLGLSGLLGGAITLWLQGRSLPRVAN